MKDIQFTKQGNTYVAEFEVNADFNLHIEKSRSGYLYMRQRSTSGKWDSVRNFQVAENDYIVDYDFTALVYPKQIRLVSEYAPTMCALTSDGDVIEIKSQSKEVEITQNGEMSVTPDDGFAYLSSVNVKTNVPQQGGGESGGGTAESSMTYYNVPKSDLANPLVIYAQLCRFENSDGTNITPPSSLMGALGNDFNPRDVTSVAIDLDLRLVVQNKMMTIRDFITLIEEGLNTLTQITKEEFYNLES